ncbi:MAG: LuxR C-terminal-related transcriptional regulator [Geminicoccaceae bacterium]
MHGSLAPDLLPSRDGPAQSAAKQVTVLLIDGRPLMRECLARGIRAEWPEARLAVTGWNELAACADGGVALCLVSLAGGGSLETVRSLLPDAALVVLGEDEGYTTVSRAAAQGARGYFTTAADLALLVQGMRLVLMGGTAMPLALPAKAAAHDPALPRSRFSAELFTPKELEVLQALAKGLPNKLIAHELSICETTVKVHLRHIFRKLGTTNRTHAALLAREMLDGPG